MESLVAAWATWEICESQLVSGHHHPGMKIKVLLIIVDWSHLFPISEKISQYVAWIWFYIYIHIYIILHHHPGGPGTVLVKTTFYLKNTCLLHFATSERTFVWHRNAHLYEPNSRFVRVLDTFHWVNLIGAFYCLFKAGASALKWFFAGTEYVDSHNAIASISHAREDLCSLNPTPPLRVYTVARTPEISAA